MKKREAIALIAAFYVFGILVGYIIGDVDYHKGKAEAYVDLYHTCEDGWDFCSEALKECVGEPTDEAPSDVIQYRAELAPPAYINATTLHEPDVIRFPRITLPSEY